MNVVRSNNISLKYERFTSSVCKDIGIRKFEFVAKTHFLYTKIDMYKFIQFFISIRYKNKNYKIIIEANQSKD